MGSVADILTEKGSEVFNVDTSASAYEALETMVSANVGSLLVLSGGAPVGIVTERDYLRKVALTESSARETPVTAIMTAPVICVGSDTSTEECMAIMTEQRLRHLPVVDDGEIAGIVSIGDLVKHKAAEQSFQIRYLTDYITAR
jgi:CBS domain-containing protein